MLCLKALGVGWIAFVFIALIFSAQPAHAQFSNCLECAYEWEYWCGPIGDETVCYIVTQICEQICEEWPPCPPTSCATVGILPLLLVVGRRIRRRRSRRDAHPSQKVIDHPSYSSVGAPEGRI